MSREEVKTYQFKCDELRFVANRPNMLELCDGKESFFGVNEFEARQDARQAGWKVSESNSFDEDCCPFHMHSINASEIWPKSESGIRGMFEIPKSKS